MTGNILARNNVKVSGSGTQPMMFAHGFGCGQNMWRFMTPAFEKDYKIILFDYVGSGKSDIKAYNQQRYGDLSGYARDVIEICDALELKDVIFVGHSVSSMIGVLASLKRPELFKSLIQIVPSPCYLNDGDYRGGFERADIEGLLDMMDKNYIAWASFLAPVIMKNEDRPELAHELAESFCQTDPDIARRFAAATFFSDNRADVARVQTPSLIIQLTDDAIAPVGVGEFLHKNMPGSSTLRLIEASGHCPHLSHPQETITAVKEYLAGEEEGGGANE